MAIARQQIQLGWLPFRRNMRAVGSAVVPRQRVEGDNAVGVQVDGDNNIVTVFAGSSKLVLDQPQKRRGAGAPANERQLLLTEWRATTLVGRADDLRALAEWRDSEPKMAIRCTIGRAGSGKTRLAIEACEAAEEEGWIAGFVSGDELRRFDEAQNLAQWRSPQNILIVIDDAATSAAILKKWLTTLARRATRPEDVKLRILLLERHADPDSDYGWWAELRRNDSRDHAGAADLIGGERPVPLATIARADERRALLAEAMRLAAGFLSKPAPTPPAAGSNPDFDRRLADDRLENEPLFLVMAGIVAADRGAPTALALSRTALAKEMAGLERSRLARLGKSWGLPADGDLIAHLAACATLQRGCDPSDMKPLIVDEMKAMDFTSSLSPERLVDLFAEALPNPSGEGIDRVRPDLIGEAFLVREIVGSRARGEDERTAIIARALQRSETKVLETLVLAAQDFAEGAANHSVVRWLAELADRSVDLGALVRIANTIPTGTLALREVGVLVSKRIVDLARENVDTRFLGHALNNLGVRLSYLGHCEAELAATQEAVDIYRALAAERPEAFNPDLAGFLCNLACCLGDLGQREAALTAAQEAVTLYRALAAEGPEVFNPDLGGSLNNMANCLSALGQREAALAAAQEAIDLYRILVVEHPDVFNPTLAGLLKNLAIRLNHLGQREAALAAAREAVDLYRGLAAERPDAFSPDLAGSLNNLANRLSDLGQREAALAAAQGAADLYRSLAAERPHAFNLNLAMSLNTLANCLRDLGQSEAALAAAQAAVGLRRVLAAERPDAFNADLAGSLNNLANQLSDLGDHEAALAAAQEATDLCRILAAERPEAFEPDFAGFLCNLACCLGDLRQWEGALAAAQEAVDLYRTLATEQPDAFKPHLAMSLSNLANCLSGLRQRETALAAAQEAVALRRALAAERPDAFSPHLAMALSVLSDMLEANGELPKAVIAGHQAVATLAPFFLTLPLAFKGAMTAYLTRYLRRANEANIAPDAELIGPIIAKYQELQGGEIHAD